MPYSGELFKAVRNSSIEAVERLLSFGEDANAPDAVGNTALMVAANLGDIGLGVARELLSFGARVNAATDSGITALHLAAARGSCRLVDLLLDKGADLHAPGLLPAICLEGCTRGTPLDAAALAGQLEVVRQLLVRDADPMLNPGHLGATPLHFAAIGPGFLAEGGHLVTRSVVPGGTRTLLIGRYPDGQALIYGALKDSLQWTKTTPENHLPIIGLLVSVGVRADTLDRRGRTPLVWAQATGALRCVEDPLSAVELAMEALQITTRVTCPQPESSVTLDAVPLHQLEAWDEPWAPRRPTLRVGLVASEKDLSFLTSQRRGKDADVLGGLQDLQRRLKSAMFVNPNLESSVLCVPPDTPCHFLITQSLKDLKSDAKVDEIWPLEGSGKKLSLDLTVEEAVSAVNPFHGKVVPTDYDDVIHIGRYFGFSRPRSGDNPDFLRHLGLSSEPDILPRLGVAELGSSPLDLHLDPFGKSDPVFSSLAVLASPRLVYRHGEDVAVLGLCLTPAGPGEGSGQVYLQLAGSDVPDSPRVVKLVGGMCCARWEGLPEGSYTAVLRWTANEARCTFTVGAYSRSSADGQWLDGPRLEGDEWVGLIRLSLYGEPVSAGQEVGIRLAVVDPLPPSPVFERTMDGGTVAFRLPNTHPACNAVALHWQYGAFHSVELPLPGGDRQSEGGVRFSCAPSEDSVPALGLHIAPDTEEFFPLTLVSPAGDAAEFVARREVEVVAVTSVFPGVETVTKTFRKVAKGQRLSLPLPVKKKPTHGFFCLGALCDAGEGRFEIHEKALPFFRATRLRVRCEVPDTVRAGARTKLAIHVEGHRRAAVAVVVQDARHHGAGGLEAGTAKCAFQALREEIEALAGPPPGTFRDHYLDAAFRMRVSPGRRVLLGTSYLCGAMAVGPLALMAVHPALAVPALVLNMGALGGLLNAATRTSFPIAPMPTPWGAHIQIDLLPVQEKKFELDVGPLLELGSQLVECARGLSLQETSRIFSNVVSPLAADLEALAGGVRPRGRWQEQPAQQRVETLFVGVVEVKGGKRTVVLDVPEVPSTWSVEAVAVDPVSLGLVTSRARFRARREVEVRADTVPAVICPQDENHVSALVSVSSSVGDAAFETTREGLPVPCTFLDGSPVQGPLTFPTDQFRDVRVPLRAGSHVFSARSGNHAGSEEVFVERGDCLTSRTRRLIVLRDGETYALKPAQRLFKVTFLEDLRALAGCCGEAVLDYGWRCSEQTAAAMLGAWGALVAARNGSRARALASLWKGLDRLDSLWRQGGFAMYPVDDRPSAWAGKLTWSHLLSMGIIRRMMDGGSALRRELSPITCRLDALMEKAACVYGQSRGSSIESCREACLMAEEQDERAAQYVLERWAVRDGPVGAYGVVQDAVLPPDFRFLGKDTFRRIETCYAAALLLNHAETRRTHASQLLGTLRWVGSQLEESGRFYSTPDSAALTVFLAAASSAGLLGQGGLVRLDGGRPMRREEAGRACRSGRVESITAVDGTAQFFVDGVMERPLPEGPPAEELQARWKLDGREVDGSSLGADLVLEVEATGYKAGMLAHVILPPCLAQEEGGVRLQVIQRDFEGMPVLRIPVTAIQTTENRPWHGNAVLRDMYRDDYVKVRPLAFSVWEAR